ncbi:hypothetical protein CRG98_030854 [Punica granatum]|uniref:Uncharacterized protein n=1 Tax=Punica granatum TaxID=22663 RepID=A0A2I0IYE5_PUNGR|nr:hypothetical protein CRG98_030854 [Punica granatum]
MGQEAQGFGWIKGPLGPLGREAAVGIPWFTRPLGSLSHLDSEHFSSCSHAIQHPEQQGAGNNELRAGELPCESVRDKGTLGHPYGRHGQPGKRKTMKRWLCTVDPPSDRDHLFTGEGEGCEEPLECDGTTQQSRGAKWRVVRARLHPASV